jgi:hypothetical protein
MVHRLEPTAKGAIIHEGGAVLMPRRSGSMQNLFQPDQSGLSQRFHSKDKSVSPAQGVVQSAIRTGPPLGVGLGAVRVVSSICRTSRAVGV